MQIIKDAFTYIALISILVLVPYACLSQAAVYPAGKEKPASRVSWDSKKGWFTIHEVYESMQFCNRSLLFVDNSKQVCLILLKGNLIKKDKR